MRPGRAVIFAIRIYQAALSPFLGRRCRFYPSCSEYFIASIETRGLLKGSLSGIMRILRCNPLNAGGYDPVIGTSCRQD